MRAPCQGCSLRHLHCHSECEEYRRYKEHQAYLKALNENPGEKDLIAYQRRLNLKLLKRKHNRKE